MNKSIERKRFPSVEAWARAVQEEKEKRMKKHQKRKQFKNPKEVVARAVKEEVHLREMRVAQPPVRAVRMADVHNRLTIRKGRIVMADGSSVAKHLKACGFVDGMSVNVVQHERMLATVAAAEMLGIG